MHQGEQGSRLPRMGKPTNEEYANLYMRGVNDGYNGEFLDEQARMLLDMLDLFGEDGVRWYLIGIREGEEDAREDEAEADPDAVEVMVDYETGEVTPIERGDEDEDEDELDPDEEPNPN